MGQGIATSYAQLAVDVFGVPIEKIRIVQGDTDRGNGFGSAGSRSLFTGGSAVQVGAERTVDKAKELAARGARGGGRRHRVPAGRLHGRRHRPRHRPVRRSPASSPRRASIVDATSDRRRADLAERLPRLRGRDRSGDAARCSVVAYASVNDVGRVVSPMIVRGQLDGGAVQGIGQALCEQVVYDRRQRPAR